MEQLSLDDPEAWKPVSGYPDLYEVSSLGRVRSLPRITQRGLRGGNLLRPNWDGKYLSVVLCDRGTKQHRRVHALVAEAFIGPRPAGMEVRHLDGNPLNNAATNLAYGTSAENSADTVRHGTHPEARKTHCDSNHEFTPENTKIVLAPDGTVRMRVCKTCHEAAKKRCDERRAREAPPCQCGSPMYAKGLCKPCYQRQWREARSKGSAA